MVLVIGKSIFRLNGWNKKKKGGRIITSLSIGTGGLGRLGNQLFTIAGCVGIATKNNQPFAFPEWRTHDNALFGLPVDKMSDYFVNPLPQLPEGLQFTDIQYHWEYKDYNLPDGNWNICSHLQSVRYFGHCMDLVRHYFRMKDEPEQNDYVAIHYRAGDYIDDPNAYHPRCSMEYYLEAIGLFPSDTKFMLFSDDIQAIDKLRHNRDLFVRMEVANGNYLEDFKLMKRCKHFITANSSYSHMAALLGEQPDKKIYMPKKWFGPSAGITFDGLYPENAIVI